MATAESLEQDIAAVREAAIATGWFAVSGPDSVTDLLLAALDLPPSVLVVQTLALDEDPATVAEREAASTALDASMASYDGGGFLTL